MLVEIAFGPAAELDFVGDFRTHDFPRIAAAQPRVGRLNLPAVADELAEDTEFVADPVTDRGQPSAARESM